MKHKIFRIVIAFLVIASFGVDNLLFVSAVSRGNDLLTFNSPTDGEIIKGTVGINWFMRDVEQNQIPFQIDLYNNACENYGKYYGTVGDSNPPQSGNNKNFDFAWDTKGAIKNKASVPDNPYCLRVCGIMVREARNYYTLCEIHTVVVANFNQSPKITSTPSGLNIKVGDSFSYALLANDPDNDALTYKFTKSPDFLAISSTTGVITTVGNVAAGSYSATVRVTDTKGSYDEQSFTINVSEASTVNIQFVSPVKADVIATQHVNVKWTIDKVTDISAVTLFYTTNGTTFTKIVSPKNTDREYSWDINGLANGNYTLMLQVDYSNGDKATQNSGEFKIAYAPNNSQSVPLVTLLKPEEGAKTKSRRPTISARYAASDGATINLDKVILKLDDVVLTSCEKAADEIVCEPKTDLALGQHKVSLTVEDSSGKQDTKEWTFEITDENGNSVTTVPTTAPTAAATPAFNLPANLSSLPTILLIICCGGLLLLIPWLIFTLWQRRQKSAQANPTRIENTTEIYPPFNENQFAAYTPAPVAPAAAPEAPVVTTNIIEPAYESTFQPTIGEQSLGGEYTSPQFNQDYGIPAYDPNTTYSVPPVAIDQNQIPQENAPSTYNGEQLPDWLKDTSVNGNTSSTPVNPTGENSNQLTYNIGDDQGSQPHDDFGIGNRGA